MQSKFFTQLFTLFLVLGVLPALAQTPFYTETFSDETASLANWTVGGENSGTETWKWSDDPAFNRWLFGIPFTAPTAADGFMVFDSDANGGTTIHQITLTSPVIDCSGQEAVFLEMYTQYLYYRWEQNFGEDIGLVSRVELGVSTNGTDYVYRDILTDVEPNDVNISAQRTAIAIPEAINQDSVYLQIKWIGAFEYILAIDDVSLYATDPILANDLSLQDIFLPSAYATPISQIDSVFFAGFARNEGADPQTNVRIQVGVLGPDLTTVHEDSSEVISMLPASSPDSVLILEDGYLPDTTGRYFVIESIEADEEDDFTGNNRTLYDFLVTESLFSVDDGDRQGFTRLSSPNADFWEAGSSFFVLNGEGYEADSVRFSIATNEEEHIGSTITILMFKVVGDDEPGFTDGDVETVAFSSYTFGPNDESGTLLTAPLFQDDGETNGIPLEDSTEYFIMLSIPNTMFVAYTYRKLLPGVYGNLGSIGRNGEDWFAGFENSPFIVRMTIRETEVIATKEPELADGQVNAFPNPAKDVYRIDLDLENASPIQLQLLNISGQTVIQREYTALQRDRIDLDVSDLPAGAYLVKVRTEEGVKTLKMTKQ